jgi:hypothetical protein
MRDWIFQANPDRYDLVAAAEAGISERWSMKVHRQTVAVGDRVWFLVAGSHAGIYVVGTVASLPYEIPEDDGFGTWKVDVSYDSFVDPPLLRSELLATPELEKFHPLRGIIGTNFQVPADIAAILEAKVEGRLRAIDGSLGAATADDSRLVEAAKATNSSQVRRVWVIRAGQGAIYADSFLALGLVAVEFGVRQSLQNLSWDDVLTLKRQADPTGVAGAIGQAAGALYRIGTDIKRGEFVLTPEPGGTLLAGEISGDYQFVHPAPVADYDHVRPVRWFARLERSKLSETARHSIGSILTIFLPAQQPELLALLDGLRTDVSPAPLTPAGSPTGTLPSVMQDPPMPGGSEPATDKQPLTFLLDKIQNRELALPDFQRSFVWDPAATRELIASIARGFPVGNLLFLRGSSEVFVPRAVEGAPALDGRQPSFLVLDGQQRLTSLYQAFTGVGAHRFFLDIRALMDGDELDAAIEAYSEVRAKQWATIESQGRALMFPLWKLRDYGDWKDEVIDHWSVKDHDKLQELRRYLNRIDKALIEPISSYLFPITTLSEKTPTEAVCTIFETLNRTGIKLTVFELITARAFAEGHRLRELWEQAQERYPVLDEFGVEAYYVLQAIALRIGLKPQRGIVVSLDVPTLVEHWDASVRGVADGLTMLRDECGVMTQKWLPYAPMLPTLGAAWRDVEDAHGAQIGARRLKLQQWFWCASFAGDYENATNSRAQADIPLLHKWLTGGESPPVVRDFEFDSKNWREVTVRQRGLYRSTMALLLSRHPRDFHYASPLTPAIMEATGVDDHHIFPTAYLRDKGIGPHTDSVINHTLIDKQTNVLIGKKAPSQYIAEIRVDLGNATDEVLRSHGLPVGTDEPLLRDDFDGFLSWRLDHFAHELNRVTGRLAPPITGEVLVGTRDLLNRGESDQLEFKSSARFNLHTKMRDERLEKRIVASVAGFLNGQGGTLLIGVDDKGVAAGLEGDYSLMAKPDNDRYQLWLLDLVAAQLGKPVLARIKVTFEQSDDKDVCRVDVERSTVPVFSRSVGSAQDEFYVRFGNSTRQLTTEEYEVYRRDRWNQ